MKRTSILLLLVVGSACSEGTFKTPQVLGGVSVPAEQLNRGKEGYTLYCLPCHGENGDGKGIAATGLRPPPRDFTQGLFKFGGVAAPSLPPDAELSRIVKSGLHGTAMLPWDVPDPEMTDIIQYLKTFSPRWKTEKAGDPLVVSPDPYKGKEAAGIEMGKRVYHAKAQCSGCHPSYVTHQELYNIVKEMAPGTEPETFSAEMYHSQIKDSEYCLEWKPQAAGAKLEDRECARPVKVMPPDFARDSVRNVRLVKNKPPSFPGTEEVTEETAFKDLYRTLGAGIGGANMPAWKGALKEEELWGLVYYVKSLVDTKDTPAADALRAKLADPANMAWAPPPKTPAVPAPTDGTTPAPTGTAPAPTGTAPAPTAPAPTPTTPAPAPAKAEPVKAAPAPATKPAALPSK